MPDPLPPSDDELVSAYLDGEASADEVARVERSPELLAEVAVLRAIAAQVASDPDPASIDPTRREAHIAAALEAATTAANVTALAPARSRPWYRQPVAAVAAVLLAVVIAVPLLANLGGDDADSDVATSASDDAPSTEPDTRDAEAEEGLLAEEAGDSGSDQATGDDGSAAAPAEMGRPAAQDISFARLSPPGPTASFASAAAVAEAYEAQLDLTDDDADVAATTTAPSIGADDEALAELACAEIFEGEVLVAIVDDVGEVLVGAIADETVVFVLDPLCDEQLFPDE